MRPSICQFCDFHVFSYPTLHVSIQTFGFFLLLFVHSYRLHPVFAHPSIHSNLLPLDTRMHSPLIHLSRPSIHSSINLPICASDHPLTSKRSIRMTIHPFILLEFIHISIIPTSTYPSSQPPPSSFPGGDDILVCLLWAIPPSS